MPLPVEGFRVEDPDCPNLGDLIRPGMLIKTSYNSGPYLIDRVWRFTWAQGAAWSLTGLHAGPGATWTEHSRGWLGDYLAIWSGEAVRFLQEFANNTDELFIVGTGINPDRPVQLAMF